MESVDSETTQYLLDRHLMSHASSYDVLQKSERLRSCNDLSELFFQLVRVLQPDLFIEAGAKDGSSSTWSRRFLPDARIVAFEANPYTFKRFAKKHSRGSAGVEYLNLALSNEVGTVSFNVNVGADGAPRADGRGSILKFDGVFENVDGTVEVEAEATTLDTFFAESNHKSSALWVDVEGASEMVLTGGDETLASASVVIIEVEDRAYWDGQWLRKDVVSHLLTKGLVPVSRDFQSRYLYNIVFVRAEALNVDRVRWALTYHLSQAGSGGDAGRQSRGPSSETGADDYDNQKSFWARVKAASLDLTDRARERLPRKR